MKCVCEAIHPPEFLILLPYPFENSNNLLKRPPHSRPGHCRIFPYQIQRPLHTGTEEIPQGITIESVKIFDTKRFRQLPMKIDFTFY